jgi:hypothetical protein
MGHIINGTVSYANISRLPAEDLPNYADVRIRTNLQRLAHKTVEEIGWAILAEHTGLDPLVLHGLLPAPVGVFEIRPPWKRGWPEYVVTYRAETPEPVNIEPLIGAEKP